jgi:hypothetical protein
MAGQYTGDPKYACKRNYHERHSGINIQPVDHIEFLIQDVFVASEKKEW